MPKIQPEVVFDRIRKGQLEFASRESDLGLQEATPGTDEHDDY